MLSLSTNTPGDLHPVWSDLVEGHAVIVARARHERYFYLKLCCARRAPKRLTTRERIALQLAAAAQSYKLVAAGIDVTVSTARYHVESALRKTGLQQRETAVWLHAALEHAAMQCPPPPAYALEPQGTTTVCACPLEQPFQLLTPAERSVALGILEGKSNTELAIERGTALRTVANQLASAFRRLGVSTRLELIRVMMGARASETKPRSSRQIGWTAPKSPGQAVTTEHPRQASNAYPMMATTPTG